MLGMGSAVWVWRALESPLLSHSGDPDWSITLWIKLSAGRTASTGPLARFHSLVCMQGLSQAESVGQDLSGLG